MCQGVHSQRIPIQEGEDVVEVSYRYRGYRRNRGGPDITVRALTAWHDSSYPSVVSIGGHIPPHACEVLDKRRKLGPQADEINDSKTNERLLDEKVRVF